MDMEGIHVLTSSEITCTSSSLEILNSLKIQDKLSSMDSRMQRVISLKQLRSILMGTLICLIKVGHVL
jgi:hypothetical protein